MENLSKQQSNYLNNVKWLNIVKYLVIPALLAAVILNSCAPAPQGQVAMPPPALPVAVVTTATDTTYQ